MKFKVKVKTLALVVAMVALGVGAATNDLDVSRQALRDGFWALARARAQASTRAEARVVILESWAREGKWAEIPKTLASWGDPPGDAFVYYRTLARAKAGDSQAVWDAYGSGIPADPVYARLAARLVADVSLAEGKPDRALEYLTKIDNPEADDRMLLADARSRLGDSQAAAALWREVLSDTNASYRAIALAAAHIGDEARLRSVVSNAVPAEVRAVARLRLGVLLLSRADRFDEGAKLIRETVSDSPDAEGARASSQELAAALLRRQDWSLAAKSYAEILEIWPSAAREESVQEGLGWALLKQGRSEEALQAFLRAEACATTDEQRAFAGAKVADALAALGRLDDSMAKYRAVVARDPNTVVAKRLSEVIRLHELESEGRNLYAKFRFAEAQRIFREVAKCDPARQGRMAFYEVFCLYGQGLDDEAERCARNLAQRTTDPALRSEVTLWLARTAFNAGRWREAVELFGRYASSPLVSGAEAAAANVWAARAALSANDFSMAIAIAAKVVEEGATPSARAEALVVQGEALIELARFDEAVLVFERAALVPEASAEIRLQSQTFRADALYAMGADNPTRYEEALVAYRALARTESLSNEARLSLAYKIGVTLEKLKRKDEAVDQYYAHVILAYREARLKGLVMNDEGSAVFARAAFRLADLCEASGHFHQAQKTLELLAASDVPAAAEAEKRIDRLKKKGVLP